MNIEFTNQAILHPDTPPPINKDPPSPSSLPLFHTLIYHPQVYPISFHPHSSIWHSILHVFSHYPLSPFHLLTFVTHSTHLPINTLPYLNPPITHQALLHPHLSFPTFPRRTPMNSIRVLARNTFFPFPPNMLPDLLDLQHFVF